MTEREKAFLQVLRASLRGEKCPHTEETPLLAAAGVNGVVPLVANALFHDGSSQNEYFRLARDLTIAQAQRTADFLLLWKRLEQRGLRPVVVKGIVCRSLYPEPELRHSADEDLLISPEELEVYVSALEAERYFPEKARDEQDEEYEFAFQGADSLLRLELHTSLFPADSEAYGDCAGFFEKAIGRAVDVCVDGVTIRTLSPTDHLLYLLCHSYKHLLYSGIGIRQVCDIALMSEKYREEIDWSYIRSACDRLHISCLCSALFQICRKHLGFYAPEGFADCEVDEGLLLEDILSGGRFAQSNIDRAHSSTMTLEAVSAARGGRRRRGVFHSVFLPLKSMQALFPYLKQKPWLLPVAWLQRIWRYLLGRKHAVPANPTRSIKIARDRIALMKAYHLMD